MAKAWLALGANLKNAKKQILTALDLIDAATEVKIIKRSKMIVSKPWGYVNQRDFHNMVVEVETNFDPFGLLKFCLDIENNMGRVRGEKWGPRIIDIDIIAYEKQIMNSDKLTLPHKHAFERDFVIEPLREIAPNMADWIIMQAKS